MRSWLQTWGWTLIVALLIFVAEGFVLLRSKRKQALQLKRSREEKAAADETARRLEAEKAVDIHIRQQLSQLANYDEVTGIYTRQAFFREVRKLLDAEPDGRFMIARFDLDRFKVYNDIYGPPAGDTLLRRIGRMLQEETGPVRVYARIEADHFAMCMPESPAEAVQRSYTILQERLCACSKDFEFTPRVGVYRIDEPDIDVSVMCDRALLALRSIKGSYTRRIAFYDDSLRRKLLEEQELVSEMSSALSAGQFVLYFQPQYNYVTGDIIGAEALVRWNHPTRGVLTPDKFLPLFERNGFISALDEYVWDRCCRYMRDWMDRTEKLVPVSVAVNISRMDIYNPRLCEVLTGLMEKYRLEPATFKLEITESAYMESPKELIGVVRGLQTAGFVVEMDDFGSGYSSLNTLKDVPVDILKLDMKFQAECMDNARGGNILSSIIRMTRWLKLPVIAEGVETKQQADYLKSIGCWYMQGYYFARPMPADDFESLLIRSSTGATDKYAGSDVDGALAFWDASAQMALIFNSFVGGAAIMEYKDGNLEAIRINDNYYDILGLTREDYEGRQLHILDDFDAENRAVILRMLHDAIATREEAACEACTLPVRSQSRVIWLHIRVRLLAKNEDSYIFYVAIENISPRKDLERQVALTRYSAALTGVFDEIYELDYVQDVATVRTSRWRDPWILGRPHSLRQNMETWLTQSVDPQDQGRLRRVFNQAARGEAAAQTLEYRFTGKQGESRWMALTLLPIDSQVYLLCNMDITQRKEAEQTAQENAALRAAALERKAEDERNRILVEQTGTSVFDYDPQTDRLVGQINIPGQGVQHRRIENYLQNLPQNESIHPDYRKVYQDMFDACIQAPHSGFIECIEDMCGTGYRWHRTHFVSVADETGRVYRVLGRERDIQEEKDQDALLSSLTQRVQGPHVNQGNMSVAENILQLFDSADDVEEAIASVLEALGSHYHVSMVYVFEDADDHSYCVNTFEWCAPGVPSQKQNMQHLSYEEDLSGREAYMRNYDEDGVFYCPDIAALPPEHRYSNEKQGIQSQLQCAIKDGGVFCGFVGFADCHRAREWTPEQVNTLMLVSKLIGAFLIKKRRGDEVIHMDSLKAALENMPSTAYIVDRETYALLYCNKAGMARAGEDIIGRTCYAEFRGLHAPCPGCPVAALKQGLRDPVEMPDPRGTWRLAQASALRWEGRSAALLVCVDITAYKTRPRRL